MNVDQLCRDIMANSDLPMTKRVELVRQVRAKASPKDDAGKVLKELAGIYMGYAWAKANNANRLVGAYLGHLLSRKV